MSRTPSLVRCCLSIYRAALLLYPRATRERFGLELLEVAEDELMAAGARGGPWAQLCTCPRLAVDALRALAEEYSDVMASRGRALARLAVACLAIAAPVWLLILLYIVWGQTWTLLITDWSTPLTMTLAFGAPLAAVATSRLSLRDAAVTASRLRALFPVSVVGAASAWAVLLVHL